MHLRIAERIEKDSDLVDRELAARLIRARVKLGHKRIELGYRC